MKQCPQCQRQYPDDFAFCQEDASTLEMMEEATVTSPDEGVLSLPVLPQKASSRQYARAAGILLGLLLLWGGVHLWTQPRKGDSGPKASPSPQTSARKEEKPFEAATSNVEKQATASTTNAIPPPTAPSGWKIYRDTHLNLSIAYPGAWKVTRREGKNNIRIQFNAPTANVYTGLDVSPSPYASFEDWEQAHPRQFYWKDLESDYRKWYKERFIPLSIEGIQLGKHKGVEWRFVIQMKGKAQNMKWDNVTIYANRSYALVCSAPSQQFTLWESIFQHIIASVQIGKTEPN